MVRNFAHFYIGIRDKAAIGRPWFVSTMCRRALSARREACVAIVYIHNCVGFLHAACSIPKGSAKTSYHRTSKVKIPTLFLFIHGLCRESGGP